VCARAPLSWTQIKKQIKTLKKDGDVASQHFRKVFVAASTTYPLGGLCALFYIAVACYFMYSGVPPISTPGMSLVYVFVPYYTCKWALQWLGNWLVRNPLDVWRSQQTWFSYGIIMCFAMYGAITVRCPVPCTFRVGRRLPQCWRVLQEKITGKAGAWLSGGSRDGGLKMSPLEYPNIVFFLFLAIGIVVSLIRFLEYGSISAPWDMWAGTRTIHAEYHVHVWASRVCGCVCVHSVGVRRVHHRVHVAHGPEVTV
jgi:hypothetical protein